MGVDEIIFWAWMNQLFCQERERERIQHSINPHEQLATANEKHFKMSAVTRFLPRDNLERPKFKNKTPQT